LSSVERDLMSHSHSLSGTGKIAIPDGFESHDHRFHWKSGLPGNTLASRARRLPEGKRFTIHPLARNKDLAVDLRNAVLVMFDQRNRGFNRRLANYRRTQAKNP
jgi:hypothetical protein